MNSLPNVVLVHGAWADGSSWGGVIQRLQAAGFKVTAPQLPMTSLADDVYRVREVLEIQDAPTVLVGHSFGGAVITKLGKDAPNVKAAIYESAFAPDKGESMKGIINSGPQPPGAAAIRPDKRGFLWLDQELFTKYFCQDVDSLHAHEMAAEQQPIAASEFMAEEAFGDPLWREVPTWFIVTEQDQMIPPDAQRQFAKRMNAKVSSIKGSHAAMVSHADEVAATIRAVAETVKMNGKVKA